MRLRSQYNLYGYERESCAGERYILIYDISSLCWGRCLKYIHTLFVLGAGPKICIHTLFVFVAGSKMYTYTFCIGAGLEICIHTLLVLGAKPKICIHTLL
jgi:hypothetical protein